MSLLSRYKGHRSSLTRFSPKDVGQSNVHKIFNSARSATLVPLDTVELNNEKKNKPVESTDIPVDNDIPSMTTMGNVKEENHVDLVIEPAPPLPPVSSSNFNDIFNKRIEICKVMCDFKQPEYDSKAKETKTEALNSFVEFTKTGDNLSKLSSEQYDALKNMVYEHIFRHKVIVNPTFLFSDDLVAIIESSMPHYSIVYNILDNIIENSPSDDTFNEAFILRIINQFSVPDITERTCLTIVITKLIGRIEKAGNHEIRKYVISKLCYTTASYLNGTRSPHVLIPSLLLLKTLMREYFGLPPEPTKDEKKNGNQAVVAIAQVQPAQEGEEVPLSEHAVLYLRYILPIFGAPHYNAISTHMHDIVDTFLSVDQTLAMPTVRALLYHWPKTRSNKLIAFLNEMTFVLTKLRSREFKEVRVPVFKEYANCAVSTNYKVAEAAFGVWQTLPLEPLIMDSAKYIFPVVYGRISKALKDHWSSNVIDSMNSTLDAMNKIDSFLFQELCRQKAPKGDDRDLVRLWATVSRTAMHSDRDLNLAAKLAEIQKTFTKPAQPPQSATLGQKKVVVQPNLSGGRRRM